MAKEDGLEERLMTFLQERANEYRQENPDISGEELCKFLEHDATQFVIDAVGSYPEELLVLTFGQDAVDAAKIDPSMVANAYDVASGIDFALDANYFKEGIDAYNAIDVDNDRKKQEAVTVYNFEVADYHTYYVGDEDVLVHNKCANQSGSDSNTSGDSKITRRQAINFAKDRDFKIIQQ